jgi:hypothetical protein
VSDVGFVPRTAAPVGAVCSCVARHDPDPGRWLEYHHRWPIYLGGPVNGPRVWLCATAHNLVHAAVNVLVKADPVRVGVPVPGRYALLAPGRLNTLTYGLAVEAYHSWVAAGRSVPKIGEVS